jgi:hypothetical protein
MFPGDYASTKASRLASRSQQVKTSLQLDSDLCAEGWLSNWMSSPQLKSLRLATWGNMKAARVHMDKSKGP